MYKSYRKTKDIVRKAPSRKAFKDIINAKSSDVTRENANRMQISCWYDDEICK